MLEQSDMEAAPAGFSHTQLPEEVLVALQAQRKVEAIKLLRKHLGIDLQASKQLVDAYTRINPALGAAHAKPASSGISLLSGLLLAGVLISGLYYLAT